MIVLCKTQWRKFLPLFIITCACCAKSKDHFVQHLGLLEGVKNELMADSIVGEHDLVAIQGSLPNEESQILFDKLLLNQVVTFSPGGISFRFGSQEKNEDKYYLIYVADPGRRNEYLAYEQFADFQIEKELINDHWTFVRTNESID